MYTKYCDAVKLSQEQAADDQLEREIVRKQRQRREPAREIARRQKNQDRPKDHPRSQSEHSVVEDKEMTDVQEVLQEKDGKGEKDDEAYVRPPDGQQLMEDALLEWNGIIDPLELALEVAANFVSCLIPKDDQDNEDGSNMMSTSSTLENAVQTLLFQGQVPNLLAHLLQSICQLKSSIANGSGAVLLEDLANITSKVSACLVNCILGQSLSIVADAGASSHSNSSTTPVNPTQFWQNLKPYIREEGVSSIVAVAVRQSPELQGLLVSSSELDFLLGLLGTSKSGEKIHRDIVVILASSVAPNGDSHTSVSNGDVSKIVSSFLALLTSSTASLSSIGVAGELLNALIDIFSEDDLYNEVFQSLNVLSHFEKALNTFAQSLQLKSSASMSQFEMEVEEQEDILFNAQRFLEYKQQTTQSMMH